MMDAIKAGATVATDLRLGQLVASVRCSRCSQRYIVHSEADLNLDPEYAEACIDSLTSEINGESHNTGHQANVLRTDGDACWAVS